MIFKRLFPHLKKLSGPPFNPKARLVLESLEERAMPTGTWTNLANPFPSDGAVNMLLLSDGTVIVALWQKSRKPARNASRPCIRPAKTGKDHDDLRVHYRREIIDMAWSQVLLM